MFASPLNFLFFCVVFFLLLSFEMRFQHHYLNLATTFALPMANGNRQPPDTSYISLAKCYEPVRRTIDRLTFQLKCERIRVRKREQIIFVWTSAMLVVSTRLCDDHFSSISSGFLSEMPFSLNSSPFIRHIRDNYL